MISGIGRAAPGRGEFIRLTLEAAKIPYRDCAREKGTNVLASDMRNEIRLPFRAAISRRRRSLHSSTADNCLLADRHGLLESKDRWFSKPASAHHRGCGRRSARCPSSGVLEPLYRNQKEEAVQSLREAFRTERIPKYLGYFADGGSKAPGPG